MRAVIFEEFAGPLTIANLPEPDLHADGVIIKVEATGICRSDWHGWLGHDPDIKQFPHVPGHELAGIVVETGSQVSLWKKGERVTVPFVNGCGTCPECTSGNHHICDFQTQPGFTQWGSYAEYVAIRHADINLVRLPESIDFVTAASLGCRFSTSFRAVVDQGQVQPGSWVAVHGCGGVGLSAIMIARAFGARVIAVDIYTEILQLAKDLGAEAVVDARTVDDVPGQIHEICKRGADISIDALGNKTTAANSIACLRKQGRHIQVGLLAGADHHPPLPMELVISRELQILGSHGMQAYKYETMLDMITGKKLDPRRIIGKRISLDEAPAELERMGDFGFEGITVIDRF